MTRHSDPDFGLGLTPARARAATPLNFLSAFDLGSLLPQKTVRQKLHKLADGFTVEWAALMAGAGVKLIANWRRV